MCKYGHGKRKKGLEPLSSCHGVMVTKTESDGKSKIQVNINLLMGAPVLVTIIEILYHFLFYLWEGKRREISPVGCRQQTRNSQGFYLFHPYSIQNQKKNALHTVAPKQLKHV